jgi:N-acetylneuraminic acid mutarotase
LTAWRRGHYGAGVTGYGRFFTTDGLAITKFCNRSSDSTKREGVRQMKMLKVLTLAVLATATVAATVCAQSVGSWIMKAPVPARLNEVAVVAVGGKVHVIGGSVLGFTGPYHLEYDPAKDAWRARAPVPRSLDHIGAAVVNNKIYAIGGFVGGATHKDGQNTAFEYDPILDTWRILAPMKAGRGSVGVAALAGKIHAIGGRAPDGRTVATHEVYDPPTNVWKELALLPKARDHAAVTAADGKIYFAGGRFGATADRTNIMDIYDPKANSWTPGPSMPTPRSGLAGTFYNGLFLVLGGELAPDTFAENEAYDPNANSWRTLAPMPGGRHATAAATAGDQVYLAAGSLKPGAGAVTDQLIVFSMP